MVENDLTILSWSKFILGTCNSVITHVIISNWSRKSRYHEVHKGTENKTTEAKMKVFLILNMVLNVGSNSKGIFSLRAITYG